MEFEWDEHKRLVNLEKHGIDFFDALRIWAGDVLDPVAQRSVEGEARPTALGTIDEDENIIAVVYGTERHCAADQRETGEAR